MHRPHVSHCLLGAAHLGFRHHLQQGGAGAIQIDAGRPGVGIVNGFARVFLEVRARDVDHAFAAVRQANRQTAARDDRQLVLADLVALGQVGIEVILAREHRAWRNLRVEGEAKPDGHVHRGPIEHGQDAWQAEVDRASLRVGRGAVGGGGARENLAERCELDVDLEPDDGFPTHVRGGCARCHAVSC